MRAWMTGMERNADLIIMSCYAPLFVNVNTATATAPKAWQWDSDLIGYNALSSAMVRRLYYVQKVFSEYLGNKIVPATFENIPVQKRPLTKKTARMVSNQNQSQLYFILQHVTIQPELFI